MASGAPAAPLVIGLAGVTGTGKSEWALRLAERLPVEIVSVDSALVYRQMDIGTAKPERAVRERVPHHLVDILDPAQSYSAGQFVSDCQTLIDAIQRRGRIPLLVGGTMLYWRALRSGIAPLPPGSHEVRERIDARAALLGWPALHAELAALDPQAAARIHVNDPQRIQRALEVCYLTGRPLTELQRNTTPRLTAPLRRWALVPAERSHLHAQLAQRLDRMLARGFLAEVEQLRRRGDLTAHHPAIRCVGYRQLWAHLDGEYSFAEARERALAATRQLAKRQITWLRAEREMQWIDPQSTRAFEAWTRELHHELAGA
jgi:tRNA dimethylallyltransferase